MEPTVRTMAHNEEELSQRGHELMVFIEGPNDALLNATAS